MAHNETTCSACNLNDGYFVSDSTLESHLRSVFDPFAADDHDHGLCEDHLDHARFVAEYDENMHELETGEVPRYADLPDVPASEDETNIAVVNDHGNVTFYYWNHADRDWTEYAAYV